MLLVDISERIPEFQSVTRVRGSRRELSILRDQENQTELYHVYRSHRGVVNTDGLDGSLAYPLRPSSAYCSRSLGVGLN